MTGPIAFEATPHPALDDPCDGVDACRDVADVTMANFNKISTYLPPVQVVQVSNAPTGTIPVTNTAWTPIPANIWAPLSITIPAQPLGLLATLNGYSDGLGWTLVGMAVTGNAAPPLAQIDWLCHGVFNRGYRGAVHYLWPGSVLNPGGVLTCTPHRYVSGATAGDRAQFSSMRLSLTAFVRTI